MLLQNGTSSREFLEINLSDAQHRFLREYAKTGENYKIKNPIQKLVLEDWNPLKIFTEI